MRVSRVHCFGRPLSSKFSLRKRTVSEVLMGREDVDKRPKITESNRQDQQAQKTEQGQEGKKRVLSIASGCRSFVAGCVMTKKKKSCSVKCAEMRVPHHPRQNPHRCHVKGVSLLKTQYTVLPETG